MAKVMHFSMSHAQETIPIETPALHFQRTPLMTEQGTSTRHKMSSVVRPKAPRFKNWSLPPGTQTKYFDVNVSLSLLPFEVNQLSLQRHAKP